MAEITFSGDGLEATTTVEPRMTAEDIITALREAGVTEGVQTSAIVGAVSDADKTKRPVPDVVVALGAPPRFRVPPQLQHRPRDTEEKLPSLNGFKSLLTVERPEEVLKAAKALTVLAVDPGDLLAMKVEGEVEPGVSVKGETIDVMAEADVSPQFTPGSGVSFDRNDGTFRAKFSGYAGISDGQVTVLPPIWVSPDEMVAAYVNAKRLPNSAPFTHEDITSALEAAGVKVGVVKERLDALGKALEAGSLKKTLVPVAAGRFPKRPVDGQAEFSFPYESQAGSVAKDGSINLKERQGFPSVSEGDLLVTCTPSVAGTPGSTVKGRELDVELPTTIELVAGENVRVEGEPECQKAYASINGGVSVQKTEKTTDGQTTVQYTLSARDVAQIGGDVDYETGNISYNGNVEIKGTIVTGFSVKATGDVVVMESVEDGAEVEAGGDVVVKQGIVGEKTRVTAKGGVKAKFIQDATIIAAGDVEADSYIRTAKVQTESEVHVTGGGASAGILGGETWALRGVVSKNIGAEGTASTLVCAGVLPTLFKDYRTAREEAKKAQETKDALLKALGIQTLDAKSAEALVVKYPRKKEQILRQLSQANEAAQAEKTRRAEMTSIGNQMKESSAVARVDVSSTAFHKVRIRIGNADTLLDQNIAGVRFRLKRGDEKGVEAVALSEADKDEDPGVGSLD